METIHESLLTRDEMEARRFAAANDLTAGLSQSRVARKFGVSRTTASRWHRALAQAGADSLKKRKATGRPCRLTAEQFQLIPEIYAQGPMLHGFADSRWTTARLAHVIETRFGVKYDHDHVGRLMHKLGLRDSDSRRRRPEAPAVGEYGTAYPASAYRGVV